MTRQIPLEELEPYMEVLDSGERKLKESMAMEIAETAYDAWVSYVKDMTQWQLLGGSGAITPYNPDSQ